MAVRRIASVAAATVTQSALSLTLSIVLARLLGPAGRGSYALLTLAALTGAALGTLGFESTSVYSLGRNPQQARRILGASLLLAAASGTTVAGMLWMTSGRGAWLPRESEPLAWVACLAIPFLTLTILLNGVLIGLGRVSDSAWLGTGSVALSLFLVSLVSLAPVQPLRGVMWAFALGSVMQTAFQLALLVRNVGAPIVERRSAFAGGIAYGLTSHASAVLHILHLRADVFLVSLFMDARAVGLYALAQAVCEWVWLVPRSAATVLFPFVAGSDDRRGQEATARTCRVVFALAGLATVGLFLTAGWLVPTIFGKAFAESVLPIRLLLPGIWAGSIAGSLSAFLAGRGHPELPLFTSLVCLAANVSLNLVLVPRHGIGGAAVASAITYALMTLVNAFLSRRIAAIPFVTLFIPGRGEISAVAHEIRLRLRALPRMT